jgi:hypothetical protein
VLGSSGSTWRIELPLAALSCSRIDSAMHSGGPDPVPHGDGVAAVTAAATARFPKPRWGSATGSSPGQVSPTPITFASASGTSRAASSTRTRREAGAAS